MMRTGKHCSFPHRLFRRSLARSTEGRAINPVTYQGIRAQLLYKFNDDWDVLVAQSYQDMHSQGVFYQQPNASD